MYLHVFIYYMYKCLVAWQKGGCGVVGCCSSVGRLRYPIWEMNVSTDQWRAAIGLFHSYSITTSCVGIRIDLVFILNWFYNITRLLKRCCVCLDILLHINFCNNLFTIILLLLLLNAGDVERNPGPDQTTHDLSILQLNIRSIRNKLDFIKRTTLWTPISYVLPKHILI